MKQVHWKKLVFQTIVWLVTEVLLTSIGTDDLADYSEFHFIYRDDNCSRIEKVATMHRFLVPAT